MFNKSQLIILSLGLCLAVYVEAAGLHTRQFGNRKHPTLEDHCYYEELEVAVKLHESVSKIPNECQRLSCGDEFVLTMETCPPTTGPCLKGDDTTKPYPDCCGCK